MRLIQDAEADVTRREVLAIVERARTPDELTAAIHAVAIYLKTNKLDDVLLSRGAALMDRVAAAGVRFGAQHPPD